MTTANIPATTTGIGSLPHHNIDTRFELFLQNGDSVSSANPDPKSLGVHDRMRLRIFLAFALSARERSH